MFFIGIDSGTQSATNDDDCSVFFDMAGLAHRPCDVPETLALFKRAYFHSALAHRLYDKCDCAGLFINVGDGKRDALRVIKSSDHNELPTLAGLGYAWDRNLK